MAQRRAERTATGGCLVEFAGLFLLGMGTLTGAAAIAILVSRDGTGWRGAGTVR